MADTLVTHQFGPWSPIRFIPVMFRPEGSPPAFYVHTTRICRGQHDFRCAHAQSQTFGPLVLEDVEASAVWTCPKCARTQPPANPGPADGPVCLYCSDTAVQHFGDSREHAAAVSAVAALHGATTTLRHAKTADADASLMLLDDTQDVFGALLADAAQAIRQDPARAMQSGYGQLTLVARAILANAKEYQDVFDPDARAARAVKAIDNGNGE